MRSADEIFAIAATRKGGPKALEELLKGSRAGKSPAKASDDRWLAAMAKNIFQAGFSWKVIEAKWDGFEKAFEGFDPAQVASYNDDDIARLLGDKDIVRNGAKIEAVVKNAALLVDLAGEHGSAGEFFADWPDEDYVGLLAFLQQRGSRLGGGTGQRMLRAMGKDSFVLSPDVVARLIEEGVVDKAPSSKKDMAAVKSAFNTWRSLSGRSLTELSRILAMSIDAQ